MREGRNGYQEETIEVDWRKERDRENGRRLRDNEKEKMRKFNVRQRGWIERTCTERMVIMFPTLH